LSDVSENRTARRIARMYCSDVGTIVFAMVATWVVLALVLHECLPLADSRRVKLILVTSALAVCIAAMAALIALLLHLRRNRGTLYREDLAHLANRDE